MVAKQLPLITNKDFRHESFSSMFAERERLRRELAMSLSDTFYRVEYFNRAGTMLHPIACSAAVTFMKENSQHYLQMSAENIPAYRGDCDIMGVMSIPYAAVLFGLSIDDMIEELTLTNDLSKVRLIGGYKFNTSLINHPDNLHQTYLK